MENPEETARRANMKYHYTPEQLVRMGKREMIVKMLGQAGISWTGYGGESWLQRELAELDKLDREDNE